MFKKTFIYSVSSGLLVLLNTGIVDHANAQKPGHVYVETKVGIDGKLLPATIDCTDQTYDIKGDGLAWMSIYQERKSRESILQEYINLCGANKRSVYRFYIKLMEGDIDNRLDVVWRQSPEGLQEEAYWNSRWLQDIEKAEEEEKAEIERLRNEEQLRGFWEERERREREQKERERTRILELGRGNPLRDYVRESWNRYRRTGCIYYFESNREVCP